MKQFTTFNQKQDQQQNNQNCKDSKNKNTKIKKVKTDSQEENLIKFQKMFYLDKIKKMNKKQEEKQKLENQMRDLHRLKKYLKNY